MRVIPLVTLIAGLYLSLPSPSSADGICRPRTFLRQQVVVQKAVPVVPVQVVKEFVPVKVLATPDYQYNFTPEFQLQILTEAVAARLAQLQQQNPPTGNGDDAHPAPSILPPGQMPRAGDSQSQVLKNAQALVNARCVECHQAAPRIVLSDLSKFTDEKDRALIFKRTQLETAKRMPKAPKPPLTQDEVETLGKWAD